MDKHCALCVRPCAPAEATCPVCGGAAVMSPGTMLGARLRVVGLVSLSSRAIVYRAESSQTPRELVLKVLRNRFGDAAPETLFPVMRVHHRSVVEAVQAGRCVDGLPYLVMVRLAGESLREYLKREHLSPSQARELAADLAEGLAALHEAGVVHGGLSADGVFLEPPARRSGRLPACLLDFRPASPKRSRADDGGTFPGLPVGPETDLHALGNLVYEAMAGVVPWHARRTDIPARRHLPLPLRLQCPDLALPPAFDDLVSRLVLPLASGRLPSAAGIAARLRRGGGRTRATGPLRDSGRYTPVHAGPWSIPGEPIGPLREPIRLTRWAEMPLLERMLRDLREERGSVAWLQSEAGAGSTTLGNLFLAAAQARGLATASVSASEPGPWMRLLSQLNPDAEAPASGSVVDALVAASAATGLALFVDDFERADAEAADVLDAMCRHLEDAGGRLAVLVVSRPLPPSPSGERMALLRALGTVRGMGGFHVLSRLHDRDIDILVESMCPLPCDAELRARVRGVADGSPMFAVRYMRHLEETGSLVEHEGALALARGVEPGLPPDLAERLMQRIQALRGLPSGAAAVDVLVRVALLGPWAERDALRAVLTLEGLGDRLAVLDECVDLLVGEGILRRVTVRHRELLLLSRPCLREVLATDQNVSAWMELAAAHVLRSVHDDSPTRAAVELSEHYERAGYPDHALDAHLLAATRAVQEGRNAEAGDRFLRAESLLKRTADPEDPRWDDVSAGLCGLLILAGRGAEAEKRLARLHGRDNPDRRLALAARLAMLRGRWHEARDAWSLLAAAADSPEHGLEAKVSLAAVDLDDGRPDLARGRMLEVEQAVSGACPERLQGLMLLVRGRLAASHGALAEAFELFARALGFLTAPVDLPDRAVALYERGILHLDIGEDDAATEGFRTGVALCRMGDFVEGEATLLAGLGRALARTGRGEEGQAAVLRAMQLRERLGVPAGVGRALVARAELALNRKDPATARQVILKALRLLEDGGDVRSVRQAHLLMGQIEMAVGASDAAVRHLHACLLTARANQDIGVVLAEAHMALARIRLGSGDLDSVHRHQMNAVVMFERMGLTLRASEARAIAADS